MLSLVRRTRTHALFLAAIVAACAHHTENTSANPLARIGVYRFSEHPQQMQGALEGRVVVTHDSVYMEADPGPCNYDARASANGPIVYKCSDVTYEFDRYDPLNRSRYRTSTTVQERQKNCARYGVDSQGRQTCLQMQTDVVDHKVPVSGTLHFTAIAKADANP
jgi:hypothetical protein